MIPKSSSNGLNESSARSGKSFALMGAWAVVLVVGVSSISLGVCPMMVELGISILVERLRATQGVSMDKSLKLVTLGVPPDWDRA